MQEVVAVKITARRDGVNERECRLRAVNHGNRHSAVQRHDGRGLKFFQDVIELENLPPIRILSPHGAAMHGGDRRLYRVRSRTSLKRCVHQRLCFGDLRLIPQAAILVFKNDEIACAVKTRIAPRIVKQHQRQKAI